MVLQVQLTRQRLCHCISTLRLCSGFCPCQASLVQPSPIWSAVPLSLASQGSGRYHSAAFVACQGPPLPTRWAGARGMHKASARLPALSRAPLGFLSRLGGSLLPHRGSSWWFCLLLFSAGLRAVVPGVQWVLEVLGEGRYVRVVVCSEVTAWVASGGWWCD